MFLKIASILLLVGLFSCNSNNSKYIYNEGQAHGTFYHVAYQSPKGNDFHSQIIKVTQGVDKSLSTFDPVSVISRINKNDTSVILDDRFIDVYKKSVEVSRATYGAFDITVAPLVNVWGFGFENPSNTDSASIRNIMEYIGYTKIKVIGRKLKKSNPKIMLDCSAIAKGYSVDCVAKRLEELGVKNYMIEIGGEVRAKGHNEKGNSWRIGIDEPSDENSVLDRKILKVVDISAGAIATSGNYRRFYVKNGKRYAHTINPKTGYPVQHQLLSVSVFATDCMTADAYATAFMVLGYDTAIEIVENDPNLEAYFILASDNNSYKIEYSKGVNKYFDNK